MAFSIKRKATDFRAAHWIERHLPLSQLSLIHISRAFQESLS